MRKVDTNVMNKQNYNLGKHMKDNGNIQISDILNSIAYSDFNNKQSESDHYYHNRKVTDNSADQNSLEHGEYRKYGNDSKIVSST